MIELIDSKNDCNASERTRNSGVARKIFGIWVANHSAPSPLSTVLVYIQFVHVTNRYCWTLAVKGNAILTGHNLLRLAAVLVQNSVGFLRTDLLKIGKCRLFFAQRVWGILISILRWHFHGYLGGVFNKTIIPLALVGHEMIIANSALDPTSASGIIVN